MEATAPSNTMSAFFSADDLKDIEQSVKEAEARTSGEIIPYAVHASDPYDEAIWRAGMTFGGVTLAVFVLIHLFSNSWQTFDLIQVALGTLAGSLLGVVVTSYADGAKRFFAGNKLMERRVAQRAAQAFLEEEVFDTRDRTGILIFLGLLEHKVVVLGDSGINSKVQKSDWEGIVKMIVDGMRSGKPADGLIGAIRQCGTLLHKHGVAIQADDKNELANRLRARDL